MECITLTLDDFVRSSKNRVPQFIHAHLGLSFDETKRPPKMSLPSIASCTVSGDTEPYIMLTILPLQNGHDRGL